MRFTTITPIVAILALAACDNEPETTAEAPVIEEPAGTTETAIVEEEAVVEDEVAVVDEPVVEEPLVEDEVTAIAPEPATGGATETADADVTVIEPEEPEVTVITPQTGGAETGATETAQLPSQQQPGAGATGGEATGALSATTAAMIDPGAYSSDQLSIELTEDGTFTLTGAGGDEVSGDWRVFGDTLTLSNVQGATGDATFPMTCTIADEGEGFRISAGTGSCEMLDGQVFEPQG